MSRMSDAFETDGTATGIAMRASTRGREKSLIEMTLGDRRDFSAMVKREEKRKADRTQIRILSVDAWRDAGGWYWNNWHNVGTCPLSVCDMKPRQLLAYMRECGFLSDASKGRVSIEDDGHNVVILDKGTREPLFALEYGAIQS